MNTDISYELAKECMRRSESCLYTSTSLFSWLRFLRWMKILFAGVPLICGSIAGWHILVNSQSPKVQYLIAICSFLAGLMPSIYLALKLDDHLDDCKRLAGEFKNLQDAYRQVALVSRHKPFDAFEAETKKLNERLENARKESVTPPEFFFKRAQKKVKSGDYSFDLDQQEVKS